jgi:hypothetical protein
MDKKVERADVFGMIGSAGLSGFLFGIALSTICMVAALGWWNMTSFIFLFVILAAGLFLGYITNSEFKDYFPYRKEEKNDN